MPTDSKRCRSHRKHDEKFIASKRGRLSKENRANQEKRIIEFWESLKNEYGLEERDAKP